MDKNLRPFVAELLGSFAVVFVSTATVCMDWAMPTSPGAGHPALYPALAYGLVYAAGLAATVHISGGFLNPAITLMLWVLKRMDGPKATGLIFVQLLGAAMAGGLVRFVFPEVILVDAKLGTPHLNYIAFGQFGINPGPGTFLSGIGLELGLTFILSFVIFATILDPRAPKFLGAWGSRLAGLWTGLVLMACTLAGFGLTGAAANPARWFGPMIWEYTIQALKDQDPRRDHFVFWLGPFLGALLAGGAYQALILPAEEESPVTAPPTATGRTAASSTLIKAKK